MYNIHPIFQQILNSIRPPDALPEQIKKWEDETGGVVVFDPFSEDYFLAATPIDAISLMESRRPPNQADVWKDYEIFDVEAKKEELTEDVYAGILDDYGIKSPDYGDEATFCVACSLLRSHGLQVEVAVGKPTLITVYHPQIREIEGEPYESPYEMYGVSMSDFL